MGKEIPLEVREQAEDLYVIEGFTYEQVAEKTGVSQSQIKRWAKEGQWRKARQEYRDALRSIRRNTVLVKKKLIEKSLQTLDPQAIYAFSRLTIATGDKASRDELQDVSTRSIKTPEEAINALQEAVELKINTMLAKPGAISFSAIKDMKKALELLEQMKAKYSKPEERKRGLSDETVEDIRRRILGIS